MTSGRKYGIAALEINYMLLDLLIIPFAFIFTSNGTEWPVLCWCAVKNPLSLFLSRPSIFERKPILNYLLLQSVFQVICMQAVGFKKSDVITCRFQSVSPGSGVVFMQPWVKVNSAHYCDVLLYKQLLLDICQAAGDFCFPTHHACARALSYCDTRLRISHQTSPPNKPDLSSVDYRLLSHSGMCLSEETSTGCQTSLMRCG